MLPKYTPDNWTLQTYLGRLKYKKSLFWISYVWRKALNLCCPRFTQFRSKFQHLFSEYNGGSYSFKLVAFEINM
jgi:hypothetical protein